MLAILAAVARAQSPASTAGDSVASLGNGPRPPTPIFQFDTLTLQVGVEGEWRRRRVETDATAAGRLLDRQTNRAARLEETLGLYIAGSLLDPRVAKFQLDVLGGWSQESYREQRPGYDLSSNPDGSVLEYDGRLTLFPAGKLTLNAYASQRDDRVPRLFQASLDRRRERYGLELLYQDAVLPMRLALETEDERLRGLEPDLRDGQRNALRRLQYEATWRPSDSQELALRAEYVDRRDEYSGSALEYETVRNDLELRHVWRLDDAGRSRLETLARFEDESGDLARDIYEISPQLWLQHSDALASFYRLQYFREAFAESRAERFRGEVGLNYRVADWLDTTAQVYGLTEKVDPHGDVDEWGAVLAASLQRDNRLGRFSANATYNHVSQQFAGADGDGVMIGEAVRFRDPLTSLLANPDIRLPSLVVTDADRARIFVLGRDYTVQSVGAYTALRRVRTGQIADGQTVLVSYLYRLSRGRSRTRDRVDLRVQQRFESGWMPYYAGSLQWEDAENERIAGEWARNVNRHRAGAEYRTSRGSTSVELEYNEDDLDPYRAAHWRGDRTLLNHAAHSLNGTASFSYFRFTGGRDLLPHEASLLDAGLSYRYVMGARWELQATAAYRYEDDSLLGVTRGVDLAGSLEWKVGQFTASIQVEYDRLDLSTARDRDLAVWFKVRREIPLIGGVR